MSNKAWDKINELDKLIRQTLKLGMNDNDTYLRIEYIYGFEKFNTRPYHNYETWSGGYRVTDVHNGIRVEEEDLDDALKAWAKQVECEHEWGKLFCLKKCGMMDPAKRKFEIT